MSAEDRYARQMAWRTICEFFSLPDTDVRTLLPALDGTAQTAVTEYGGNGVPSNSLGNNGDIYWRGDGTVGSNLYKKAAGSWSAIL